MFNSLSVFISRFRTSENRLTVKFESKFTIFTTSVIEDRAAQNITFFSRVTGEGLLRLQVRVNCTNINSVITFFVML